jgi:hypothetical protein
MLILTFVCLLFFTQFSHELNGIDGKHRKRKCRIGKYRKKKQENVESENRNDIYNKKENIEREM